MLQEDGSVQGLTRYVLPTEEKECIFNISETNQLELVKQAAITSKIY